MPSSPSWGLWHLSHLRLLLVARGSPVVHPLGQAGHQAGPRGH